MRRAALTSRSDGCHETPTSGVEIPVSRLAISENFTASSDPSATIQWHKALKFPPLIIAMSQAPLGKFRSRELGQFSKRQYSPILCSLFGSGGFLYRSMFGQSI